MSRNRTAKKPKILSDKIKLAELIKEHWRAVTYSKHITGVYWQGVFESQSGQLSIRIYFQRYARRIGKVDYVDLHWNNVDGQPALRPDEIKMLLYSKETTIDKR